MNLDTSFGTATGAPLSHEDKKILSSSYVEKLLDLGGVQLLMPTIQKAIKRYVDARGWEMSDVPVGQLRQYPMYSNQKATILPLFSEQF